MGVFSFLGLPCARPYIPPALGSSGGPIIQHQGRELPCILKKKRKRVCVCVTFVKDSFILKTGINILSGVKATVGVGHCDFISGKISIKIVNSRIWLF